jgi:hypothetical protein
MKPTTVYLLQVGQKRENVLVAERNKNDTVVGQRRERGVDGHFLPSARGTGGNKDTGVLASEGTTSPETTRGIPEDLRRIGRSVHDILSIGRGGYLPLGGERTITGRDTEEEAIVVVEVARSEDGVIRLGGGVKLGQDFGAESLLDPVGQGSEGGKIKKEKDVLEDFGRTTSLFDAGLDTFSDCWWKM